VHCSGSTASKCGGDSYQPRNLRAWRFSTIVHCMVQYHQISHSFTSLAPFVPRLSEPNLISHWFKLYKTQNLGARSSCYLRIQLQRTSSRYGTSWWCGVVNTDKEICRQYSRPFFRRSSRKVDKTCGQLCLRKWGHNAARRYRKWHHKIHCGREAGFWGAERRVHSAHGIRCLTPIAHTPFLHI
jgi:hypothetical protein